MPSLLRLPGGFRVQSDRLARAVRAVVEPIEGRCLFNAAITATDITSPAASHTVSVTYTDSDNVDVTSIDSSDLVVSGPQTVGATLQGTSGTGTTVTATYVLAGPGGGWDPADNGAYTINISAANVKDGAGQQHRMRGEREFQRQHHRCERPNGANHRPRPDGGGDIAHDHGNLH